MIVIATHDLDLAEGLLTGSVVLRDGRVAAIHADGMAVRARYEAAVRPRAAAS
jgi:energy-coupling factor transporter ATP-binding protein EcfA2